MPRYTLGAAWTDGVYPNSYLIGGLMEHVMGWEIFPSWYTFQCKYEDPIESGHWQVSPTNVAVAESGHTNRWRIFSPEHEYLFHFDPAHNQIDAQRIMTHLYTSKSPLLLQFGVNLLREPIDLVDGEFPWLYWMLITSRPWEPEQICRAAYDAARSKYLNEIKE